MWHSKWRRTGVNLIAAGFIAVVSSVNACAAGGSPQAPAALVHTDGSVVGVPDVTVSAPLGASERRSFRYDFALPRKPPERRWLEADALPICHTRWEKDGIRYTQIVLETRLGEGDLTPAGRPAADAVLMVQLMGENLTNEYSEATAAFAVQIGGQSLKLELRDGLAYIAGTNDPVVLAAIDISATGITGAAGPQLRFGGQMPPGTSGAMTIKIPTMALKDEAAINRLRELEFDEEFRRVKRFWEDHIRTAAAQSLPVAFSRPDK